MDLDAIEAVLLAWLEKWSALSGSVAWEDAPRVNFPGQFPYGLITAPDRIGGQGWDWKVLTPNVGTPDNLDETIAGRREFVITFRVQSPSSSGSLSARAPVERVRNALSRSSALAELAAAGIAVVTYGEAKNYSLRTDGRMQSLAVIELRLAVALNDPDPNPAGSVGTVAALAVSSTLQGAGTPPSIVDEIWVKPGETYP